MALREARRRAPRVAVKLEATLRGRVARPVVVVDLSLTGCLFRAAAPLDAGSIHDLELALGTQALRAKLRVTGCSRDGDAVPGGPAFLVGAEFVRLAARDEAGLRAFVDAEVRRCPPSR